MNKSIRIEVRYARSGTGAASQYSLQLENAAIRVIRALAVIRDLECGLDYVLTLYGLCTVYVQDMYIIIKKTNEIRE